MELTPRRRGRRGRLSRQSRLFDFVLVAAAVPACLRQGSWGSGQHGFLGQVGRVRHRLGHSALRAEQKPTHRLADGAPPKSPARRTKKSALALALGVPGVLQDADLSAFVRFAARGLLGAAGICACLAALLRVTSWFEGLSHSLVSILRCKSPWTAAATGVAVGTLHTVSGPDHLAGLAPLVIGQRRSPAAAFGLGSLWGTGHATGQAIIGLGCLAVHAGLLHMAWAPGLSQASGAIVGASLVAIGLLGLREARVFEEADVAPAGDAVPERRRFGWTTYATGVLHGLSPDAVLFLAPAFALPRVAALSHVAGVVLGTLVSMGACTALLSALCRRSPRLKVISTSASSVAMLLGVCILATSLGFTTPLDSL